MARLEVLPGWKLNDYLLDTDNFFTLSVIFFYRDDRRIWHQMASFSSTQFYDKILCLKHLRDLYINRARNSVSSFESQNVVIKVDVDRAAHEER